MTLISTNPATSEEIKTYPEYSSSKIDQILSKSMNAQKKWSLLKLDFRLECISQISGVLRDNKREYASLMASEMGKPIVQAIGEVEKCAWLCDYYKEFAPDLRIFSNTKILIDNLVKFKI